MMYWLLKPILWLIVKLIYLVCGGIRFEGRENVPRTGGMVVTPNHISDADPPTVCLALPRGAYVMAKEELFEIKVIGPIIRWMHGFPIKRYTADRAALRYADTLLKSGKPVVIFPEAKVSEDGSLLPMFAGALHLAQYAKVPLLPVALIGTDGLMPYGKVIPHRMKRPAIVRFGPPIMVEELTGPGRRNEALRRGAERLRLCVQALIDNRPYPTFDLSAERQDDIPHSDAASAAS